MTDDHSHFCCALHGSNVNQQFMDLRGAAYAWFHEDALFGLRKSSSPFSAIPYLSARINNQTIAPMNAKVERFSIVSTVSPISIGHLLTQAPYQTDTKQYANKHERESTDCNQLFYGIDGSRQDHCCT